MKKVFFIEHSLFLFLTININFYFKNELFLSTIQADYGQILCCSHPKEGEDTLSAAIRRLDEEMGIKTSLRKVYDFIYKAKVGNSLIEHEFDHVFYGIYDSDPVLNKEEADDYKWIDMETLKNDIDKNPDQYTVWFKIAFDYFYNYLKK